MLIAQLYNGPLETVSLRLPSINAIFDHKFQHVHSLFRVASTRTRRVVEIVCLQTCVCVYACVRVSCSGTIFGPFWGPFWGPFCVRF